MGAGGARYEASDTDRVGGVDSAPDGSTASDPLTRRLRSALYPYMPPSTACGWIWTTRCRWGLPRTAGPTAAGRPWEWAGS
ncbi:MAG: hypothetical protein KY467_03645 [Gemmatimonadetes bacterium]|nr:hypothetical protein [Gemmatimonadota bacterium]